MTLVTTLQKQSEDLGTGYITNYNVYTREHRGQVRLFRDLYFIINAFFFFSLLFFLLKDYFKTLMIFTLFSLTDV